MKYTIFAIDAEGIESHRILFEKAFADSDATRGNLIPMIGAYKGVEENSYICLTSDFEAFVKPNGYVDLQESVLRVSECNKRYAELLFRDGSREFIGCLKDVPENVARAHDAWSYRPDMGVYWIAVDGNPDHIMEGVDPKPIYLTDSEREDVWHALDSLAISSDPMTPSEEIMEKFLNV